MEPIAIPAAVLAFLIHLGCTPVTEVYEVDTIPIQAQGKELIGLYCFYASPPECPASGTVYLKKGAYDAGVLVHELWHSCQEPAQWRTREWVMNEKHAQGVERHWRGE